MRYHQQPTRREFLSHASGAGLTAAGMTIGSLSKTARAQAAPTPTDHDQQQPFPLGKAEHCILVWLGGGSCHIDTWDPKRLGDATQKNKPGSYYPAIDTAVSGVQVCEHLAGCAKIFDRFNILRTVHHNVVDEHAAATNRMHTGRATSGTIVYPSIGSIIAHERGAVANGVPAYVVIGYPNVTRGPGFLGAKAGFVYLTDTETGPSGLSRPAGFSETRVARRERLLARMRDSYLKKNHGDERVANYDETIAEALRLSGPKFGSVFQLDREPDTLRQAYGGEFGQRCLLARRLLQSGVRFIEVSHNLNFVNGTGWDTHNEGQKNQHLLIRELDSALSTLVSDLEQKKMLNKTLVVVASEFGRPAKFDARGGRGHHSKAFSVVLAGGGLRNGTVIGETDELGMTIASRPVSVPDMHATIHCALGIDPSKELYAGERPVPITDMGKPVRELFS